MPAGRYDLIIVGGGPAGLVAARAAAALGVQVALVEREVLGGTSLNTGSVPSKTLLRTARVYAEMQQAARYGARAPAAVAIDALTAMQRLHQVRARLARPDSVRRLTDLGIEVLHGHARFIAGDRLRVDGAELTFDKAMIATGSRPDRPSLPGLDQAGYLTNESVFELTELPRRLLVIGGGPLGCELAQAFCRLGVKTTIFEENARTLNERLGSLAHELRNLLNTATLAYAAIKGGHGAVAGATGAVLDRSLDGLRSLVDRALADVRLTAGLQARRESTSLDVVLEEIRIAAQLDATARHVEFTVSLEPGLSIATDREMLSSALANLLQNAFKFTRAGGHVTLTARVVAGHVRIEVADQCGGCRRAGPKNSFCRSCNGATIVPVSAWAFRSAAALSTRSAGRWRCGTCPAPAACSRSTSL